MKQLHNWLFRKHLALAQRTGFRGMGARSPGAILEQRHYFEGWASADSHGPLRIAAAPDLYGHLTGVAGTVIAVGQVRAVLAFVLLCVIFRWKSHREGRLVD